MRPFPLKMAVSYSYKQNKPLLRRKFSMRKNLTEVVFILDRSGSMSGLEKDTIGGFNSMIEKQKREAGQALISTVLFNNNSKVLYDRVEGQKIPSMTEDDYSVYGCTALLDAIGGAIHHIGNVHKYARTEDVPEHTIFIIMTDGMENASHIYRIDKVKQMIERQKEKYGWEFLFLGANIDAIETAIRSNDNGTYLSFLFWNLFPRIKIPVLDLRNMPQDSGNLSLKSVKVRL